MKNIFLLLILTMTFFACKNDKTATTETTPDTTEAAPATTDGAQATVNIPAGADGVVHHYICPDQCKGGHSANPGNCPVCGKTLAHNQAFHNQPGQSNTMQTEAGAPTVVQQAPPTQVQPQAQTPEVNIPAGSDGIVHHYICAAGCKGGHSANAGNCPVCGKALAHNQAFHKQ